MHIPFNRPFMTGNELRYIQQAHAQGHLSSSGPFSRKCQSWLEERVGCRKALLTHSGTAALEMAAILADIGPGDEVIMPSYTFTSTANAFLLRGAVPVFVDIRPDTLNLDERLIEQAITSRTKAIVPVHYAGVACHMEKILAIAERHGLCVIEDAAQALFSTYRHRPLGSLGHLAAVSFHETKNVIAGEGGALLVNDKRFVERAEIVLEKGTNRRKFLLGHVDKYSWCDIGSSYGPSELIAAFLWAQLEQADEITAARLRIWQRYHQSFAALDAAGKIERPTIPAYARHNAHLYYLLAPNEESRRQLLVGLNAAGIGAVFHYVPLHESAAGQRWGRASRDLHLTESCSRRIVRLPLWVELPLESVDEIVEQVEQIAAQWPDALTARIGHRQTKAA